MGTLTGFYGSGGVKTIQRGTITVTIAGGASTGSNTATLSPAVDATRSLAFMNGFTVVSEADVFARIVLTDGSTVTATSTRAGSTGVATVTVAYAVLEFI